MAKIHKNAKRFPIRWDGTVQGGETQGDSIPSSVDLGTWTGYTPCFTVAGTYIHDVSLCSGDLDSYYFEDFDLIDDGSINVLDVINALNNGASTEYFGRLREIAILGTKPIPPRAPRARGNYTWGDIGFIQEIMDGIGTGSRRARQDRLNKILDDEDKKKKLLHLICRIKGEKVYDDYTEVGSVSVDIDDVELVVERMMGKKLKLEIKSGV